MGKLLVSVPCLDRKREVGGGSYGGRGGSVDSEHASALELSGTRGSQRRVVGLKKGFDDHRNGK